MAQTNHVLTITDDNIERTYTDVIPLNGANGYVEIIDNFYGGRAKIVPIPPNISYTSVSIKRHRSNTIIIEARLDNQSAIVMDPSFPGSQHSCCSGYSKYGFGWKPWKTDAIVSYEDTYKFTRNDRLRGGNRLKIDLHEPSAFTITIPVDCDIKIDTKQTPIISYLTPAIKNDVSNGLLLAEYLGVPPVHAESEEDRDISQDELIVPTQLSVDAREVNVCGSSGCGGRWDYFWGTPDKDPVTHIVAQGAKVFMPTKNMRLGTHEQFWMTHCSKP